MKKNCILALMAILALCFTSCQKEQSSFEVADIQTTANVRGTILQNFGQEYKDGKHIQNLTPAAGRKVYVEIQNSELAPDDQDGVTVFETVTDGNGAYSIDVPVLYGGTTVTVKAEQFVGTYKNVVDVADNKPIFEDIEGVYAIQEKTITLNPNDIKFNDALYAIDEREENDICKYYSTFIVKVGTPQYNVDEVVDENNAVKKFISRKYALAPNVNLVVTINNICYGATTDANGEAKFIIPSKEKRWDAEIDIDALPYVVNNFNYIKQEQKEEEKIKYDALGNPFVTKEIVTVFTTQKIESGIMSQFYQNEEDIIFSGINGDKTPVIKVAMGFEPHEDVENYGYSKNEWYDIQLNF